MATLSTAAPTSSLLSDLLENPLPTYFLPPPPPPPLPANLPKDALTSSDNLYLHIPNDLPSPASLPPAPPSPSAADAASPAPAPDPYFPVAPSITIHCTFLTVHPQDSSSSSFSSLPSAARFRRRPLVSAPPAAAGWLKYSRVSGVKNLIFAHLQSLLQSESPPTSNDSSDWCDVTDHIPQAFSEGTEPPPEQAPPEQAPPENPIKTYLSIRITPSPTLPFPSAISLLSSLSAPDHYVCRAMVLLMNDYALVHSPPPSCTHDPSSDSSLSTSSRPPPHSEIFDADSVPALTRNTSNTSTRSRLSSFRLSQSPRWSFSKDDAGKEPDDSSDDEDATIWLDDEDQSMLVLFPNESNEDTLKSSSRSLNGTASPPPTSYLMNPIHLSLSPAYLTPPPSIRLRIPFTQTGTDMFQKSFTQYHMFIKQGRLSWRVVKRFSDYVALHDDLRDNKANAGYPIDVTTLPKLPRKTLPGLNKLSDSLVQTRRDCLEKWMRALMKADHATDNVAVLSFLGIVNNARFEGGAGVVPQRLNSAGTAHSHDDAATAAPGDAKPPSKAQNKADKLLGLDTAEAPALSYVNMNRQVIHISQLRGLVKWGDLILFRCANPVSGAQRAVTGAEWDHVALVVKRRYSRTLELLEATGEGVQCYPLISRLRAYGSEFTRYMAVRSLEHTRTFEEYENMAQFLESVEGVPYGFNLGKLFGAMTINTKIGMGEKKKGWKGEEEGKEHEEEEDDEVEQVQTNGPAPSLGAIKAAEDKPKNNKGAAGGGAAGMGGIAGAGTLFDFTNKKNYFCSELIAACLKSMGIMYSRRNETYFWPGEFGRGAAIDRSMIAGACYGEELVIDCKILEIGNARVQEDRGGGEGVF